MTTQRKLIDGTTITGVSLGVGSLAPLATLAISKVTKLTTEGPGRIYLEQLDDGTWRLTYTSSTIPDLSKLRALYIHSPEIDAADAAIAAADREREAQDSDASGGGAIEYALRRMTSAEPTVELVPIRMGGPDIIGWRVGGEGSLHVSPLDPGRISLPRRLFTDAEAINGADISAQALWARLTDAGLPVPESIRVEITKP